MTDKKLTIKRLVIFLMIAFLPFIIIVPIMNAHYGKPIYECEEAAAAVYALGIFGMMIPTVSNIITRLVTKEGFRNSYLALNIEGNVKYYAASIWVKLAEITGGSLLIWLMLLNDMNFNEVFVFEDMKTKTGAILITLALSVILFFPGFGEEWGWRGYMMPKLMELMPKPAAVVVGGIIWGLWHAPLTVSGHNFPTDHKGYPFSGILLMCTMCIIFNTFLTLITERTKSVYPASFCHMVNNSFAGAALFTLFGTETAVERLSEISAISLFFTGLPVSVIIAVISMALLMKKQEVIKVHHDETVERITRMEKYFDALKKAVQDKTFINEGEQAEMLCILTEYYENGQWLSDYEKDERGELPDGLKRGVLSQDGIYDLLCDIKEYKN